MLGGAGTSPDSGKVVVGGCWRHFEATKVLHFGAAKPVSQDWGKIVVGRAGALLKQPNLSARIAVKSLLESWRHQTFQPGLG